ncbi:hypothetical protein H8959_006904 [Pygathrix nigripes]
MGRSAENGFELWEEEGSHPPERSKNRSGTFPGKVAGGQTCVATRTRRMRRTQILRRAAPAASGLRLSLFSEHRPWRHAHLHPRPPSLPPTARPSRRDLPRAAPSTGLSPLQTGVVATLH